MTDHKPHLTPPAERLRADSPDMTAWIQANLDGTGTLYCIRIGCPTLIITGLRIRPASPVVPAVGGVSPA